MPREQHPARYLVEGVLVDLAVFHNEIDRWNISSD